MRETHPRLSRFPPHLTDMGSIDSSVVQLASEAMAVDYNFTHIPGFFAQDDPNAGAGAIGPVSRMR